MAKDSKDIWDESEVVDERGDCRSDDPRPEPEYDIVYKQDVSSEDMCAELPHPLPRLLLLLSSSSSSSYYFNYYCCYYIGGGGGGSEEGY